MSWDFSFGWLFLGITIVIAGALIVVFYQKIAEGLASGVSSYDRVKLFGVITIIVGLIITANLHTLLLSLLVSLIFPN